MKKKHMKQNQKKVKEKNKRKKQIPCNIPAGYVEF